jgi:hypothetical protein
MRAQSIWDQSEHSENLTFEDMENLSPMRAWRIYVQRKHREHWATKTFDLWEYREHFANESIHSRVRPFRLKKIFAYKRNKANLDPFHMCFTISLINFTYLFSLLFAYFRFKFFASLRFEAKQNSSLFFRFFNDDISVFSLQRLFHTQFFIW